MHSNGTPEILGHGNGINACMDISRIMHPTSWSWWGTRSSTMNSMNSFPRYVQHICCLIYYLDYFRWGKWCDGCGRTMQATSKRWSHCMPHLFLIKRAWSPLSAPMKVVVVWASTTQDSPVFCVLSSICPRFSMIQQSNEHGHRCDFTNVLDWYLGCERSSKMGVWLQVLPTGQHSCIMVISQEKTSTLPDSTKVSCVVSY